MGMCSVLLGLWTYGREKKEDESYFCVFATFSVVFDGTVKIA